ncbi:MAG: cytochrome-c oxidase, cbb3-type subunit III [Rhodospirillaceae bacterium]|jgi:cytochrome c oxidase cbb3-type subunit III|nr:cytochrome-c oxidase, cbb3-type subunit III [Rhodospirillaceae bacterium]MBT5516224.1 cytochrome-c oxidase, cbb3-type subunit III [Rhodospirillaceae bacterium]MBT6085245.1 cytochrome-c oxidase, cbb3-type subunit III [Rhodospirillaceae bacterium]MBT7249127.1 cytochrome-c oxidase, cbb3-type subunit III [Rhodospirillaceae bacterium]
MTEQPHVDEFTGVQTTGHEWDGIRELDNPLPRWWQWILWATVVWSVGYWFVYPAWPLISSHTKGFIGYSSRGELRDDVAAAKARQAGHLAKLAKASLEQIRTDPELLEFALAGGRSAYNVNCSQCHGSGAQGFAGYPNLNDDEWLWGGRLEDIHQTIMHGVRNEDSEDARVFAMPAFLKDEILDANQVEEVATYVLHLSKQQGDSAASARGKALFLEHCVACHGDRGQGNAEFGAPSLNNDIWLYGGEKAEIVATIANSRGGVMPAWGRILDAVTIKKLAIYVHSLGGGS